MTPPRPSRAATRHKALHGRLLDAAEAVIAAEGLPGVKARMLAEAAGCSVGAIYGVFEDIDALILGVNGRTLDAIALALAAVEERGDPAEQLASRAEAYLAYAAAHRQRWRALFQHRMPPGRPSSPDHAARQENALSFIEAPLAALLPAMPGPQRTVLARTLFAAVHGMVDLGLDETVASLGPAALRSQIRMVVAAVAAGLPGR